MLVSILCQTVSKNIDTNSVLWNKSDLQMVYITKHLLSGEKLLLVQSSQFHIKESCRREGIFAFNVVITQLILVNFSHRVLETTSNAASSVHSKKSKIKHQAEAEKQKAEAEAKAAKDREEVGSFVQWFVYHTIFVGESVTNTACNQHCVTKMACDIHYATNVVHKQFVG